MSVTTRQQLAELNKLPPAEQERIKKEEIARQRELRLQQRLLKRESITNADAPLNTTSHLLNDETSQASSMNTNQSSSGTNLNSSDFNIRNYFLMHKVLSKVLMCKYAWPFKDAVSEEDAPDYNTIISVILRF